MINEDIDILNSRLSAIPKLPKYDFSNESGEKSSYFNDIYIQIDVYNYSFDKPIDLKNKLQELWALFDHKEFESLNDVITVIAFKNKDNNVGAYNISPYIYEM